MEAAGSGSDDYDTHVDKHSAAAHTPGGGAIPAECRSQREHPDNDNWSEMGTAYHNHMEWPAAAAAAAAEIAATARSSDVGGRLGGTCTDNGRSRAVDAEAVEGDRHSRTRQIRTPHSLHDNLEQEAEVHKPQHKDGRIRRRHVLVVQQLQQQYQHVPDHHRGHVLGRGCADDALHYYFPSRHGPPGPSRPHLGGHRHRPAEAGRHPDLRHRRSPCVLLACYGGDFEK